MKESIQVFKDVDKLQQAIEEEEKKRPSILKEESLYAEVGYVLTPSHVPRKHCNLNLGVAKKLEKFT